MNNNNNNNNIFSIYLIHSYYLSVQKTHSYYLSKKKYIVTKKVNFVVKILLSVIKFDSLESSIIGSIYEWIEVGDSNFNEYYNF